MRLGKEQPPILAEKQIADLVGTFTPSTRPNKRPSVPHMVLVDGKQVSVASGKYAWGSAGAARNALINHVDSLTSGARYSSRSRASADDPLFSLTVPPSRPMGYRDLIAPTRLIVTALLATGRVRIVPIPVPDTTTGDTVGARR